MVKFEYYQKFIEEAVINLKNYLLSDVLFWNLGLPRRIGEQPYPKLTIGNLLLFLHIAEALASTPIDEHKHKTMLNQVNQIRDKWRSAWRSKSTNEFVSRVRQWKLYLDEVLQSEDYTEGAYYSTEVKLRTILKLLEPILDNESSQISLLVQSDKVLRAVFQEGEFIWETEIDSVFPDDEYWFLWGKISG